VWAVIAVAFARLTGSWPVALFRTALAAFPVTLVWSLDIMRGHPGVLWLAAASPLAGAMLAHGARLALIRHDDRGKPIVTKDDVGRAVAGHAMGAIGALYVLSTLITVREALTWMIYSGDRVAVEFWVWVGIVLIAITALAMHYLLFRAPGYDLSALGTQEVESVGATITYGLLAFSCFGWIVLAIRYAHTIGPHVLAGVMHLAVLLLAVLFWVEIDKLLQRWRTRYGGQIQLDAFGCAMLVVSSPLMLGAGLIFTLLGVYDLTLGLCLVAIVALAAGAALTVYYLPAGEHEPLARIVAYALGPPLLACILVLWRLPPSLYSYRRDHFLWMLLWINGIALAAVVTFIVERHGFFDDPGSGRTTRNSRIDDGDDGDTMNRE
jgi:hypothetical protein